MSESKEDRLSELRNGSKASPFDRPGLVLLIYLGLTLVMTYPLAVRFATHVPAGAVDLWQNYWNFWWWKTALLELHQSPFHTPMLFHPSGTSMAFYTHSPFNMIVAMPVALLLGPGAAYNFCVVLAVTLSGVTAWMLGRELTGNGKSGFLCGAVFAFFPQHIEQTLEHLNLFSTQFIPLTVLYLIRLNREGGWKNIVGLAVAFALNTLCCSHLGIMLTMFLVPLFCLEFARKQRPWGRNFLDHALAAILATVIVLPFILPMIMGMLASAGEGAYFQKEQQDRGIDLLFTFIPNFNHPIFGWLTLDYWARNRGYGAAGFVSYLGFIPLALAVIAGWKRKSGWIIWSLLFVATFILALGARPWVGGKIVEIPLPFALFEHLPLLSLLRVANRFLIFSSLALGILMAMGWGTIESRTPQLFYVVCALTLFEYLWLPYPMVRDDFPAHYEEMAKAPYTEGVLDIPFNANGMTVHNMRAQTVHGRKIAGGYLSTVPPEPINAILQDPVLSVLVGGKPSEVVPEVPAPLDAAHLRQVGFNTIVMHKYRTNGFQKTEAERLDPKDLFGEKIVSRLGGIPEERFDQIRLAVEAACGKPTYEDELIIVFEIPEADQAAQPLERTL